jgi:DNA-binding LytR/AlgR family response regulator
VYKGIKERDVDMIRVIIVEDEEPARNRIRLMLSKYPDIEIVGLADNGSDAMNIINEHKPDLLFLDIQIPQMNGFEVLSQISDPPVVIFITAHDHYAIQAFDVRAIDYLMKPYSQDRFDQAIVRARALLGNQKEQRLNFRALSRHRTPPRDGVTSISVTRSGRSIVLPLSTVDFFEADQGLVFLCSGSERYVVNKTLKQLEEILNEQAFIRVHRGYIVNRERIIRLDSLGGGQYQITLSSGQRIPVGRKRVADVTKCL